MNDRFLLSIAIPTWNRAASLYRALERLIPQVRDCSDRVELIISDNNSTDNTREVIEKHRSSNSDLEIVVHYQDRNTGFFGNFKKCKELARGRFFWLLSDDDYVQDGVVNLLVEFFSNNPDIAFVFLESVWGPKGAAVQIGDPELVKHIILEHTYKLTLISVVIFRNVTLEHGLIGTFAGNDFLGFIIFISSLRRTDRGVIISGETLLGNNEKHRGFNWFKAFGEDLPKAIRLLENLDFTGRDQRAFMGDILGVLIREKLILYKAQGTLQGEYHYDSLGKIYCTITRNFIGVPGFLEIFLIMAIPRPFFRMLYGFRMRRKKR